MTDKKRRTFLKNLGLVGGALVTTPAMCLVTLLNNTYLIKNSKFSFKYLNILLDN
ncbi:twin-arginine translocation signal domain-containing protein [Mariniflexile sp.]|uniref:twin-arginine translocation signal domain-containing protein n=1 Tax=Mariniflexile sp. TaxID=1979402 RepID=UPI004048B19C